MEIYPDAELTQTEARHYKIRTKEWTPDRPKGGRTYREA